MKFGTVPPRNNGKHPGGRPSKKTPEAVAKLSAALAMGMPDIFACDLIGITRETLDEWRNADDELSYSLKAARAEKMGHRIQRIDVGDPGWQGSAWMLERTYPQHFARPELQVTMQVQHAGSIEHTVQMVAESELQRMSLLAREIDAEVIE